MPGQGAAHNGMAAGLFTISAIDPHDPLLAASPLDHPIFRESIHLIRAALEPTGVYARFPDPAERDVL